ncbi:hypothetical protein [Mucilaginibacter sp.]
MTPEQRYTLLWLTSAMTLPAYFTTERYFYDGMNQCFFTRLQADNCGVRFVIKNHYGKPFYLPIEADLQVRVELINDDMSEIIEIPRLNVQDKVAIQQAFLANFHGVYFEQELSKAIGKQSNDFSLVLDRVLNFHNDAIHLMPYWEEYKLDTVMQYLNVFTNAIGVNLIIS